MKSILFIIFLFISFNPGRIISQDYTPSGLVRINLLTSYENWDAADNARFTELTTVLNLNYLPSRNTNVAFSSRYATVGGDANKLNGFSDVQLFISQKFQEYNLVLNGGINVPSGKTKLTTDEFLTSRLISQNLFNLKTSNFGQGLNIFFGAAWTHPISDNFVIGGGLSYQIKSEYQPINELPQKYQPSNEISAAAGFDSKLNETATLSGDITAIFYGSDKVDGQKIFSTGNRFIFNSLYKQYFGYHILSVFVLYRAIGIGKYEEENPLIENEKINPNQLYFGSAFNHRVSPYLRLSYGIALSNYEKTSAFYSGYTLYEISLSPELKLNPMITIPIILKFAMGTAKDKSDLKNYELGIGIRVNL